MTDSPERYLQQCKPQFGESNPERMQFPHWEWMVRSGKDPYWVRSDLGVLAYLRKCDDGDQRSATHPDWCFDRMGMTRTRMSDGRIICIGGEHEDSYDPDFCIYNDVVVLRPAPGEDWVTLQSGEVEIYGYPQSVFEPTDFHSATLVENTIYIIGSLGYETSRQPNRTPVMALDTETYRMARVETTGPEPGRIYEHHASYDAARHAITVRGGSIWSVAEEAEIRHAGATRLYLNKMRWELIAVTEKHRKFLLKGHDDFLNDYDEPGKNVFVSSDKNYMPLEPVEEGVMVYGLDVLGVRFRFEVWIEEVRTLVEGELPPQIINAVLEEITGNLRADSGFEWTIHEVDRFD
jgi:hypothetical protein